MERGFLKLETVKVRVVLAGMVDEMAERSWRVSLEKDETRVYWLKGALTVTT